ncbi:MAG TPA: hypothetical protein VF742_12860 [Terracidiphilus sp.]
MIHFLLVTLLLFVVFGLLGLSSEANKRDKILRQGRYAPKFEPESYFGQSERKRRAEIKRHIDSGGSTWTLGKNLNAAPPAKNRRKKPTGR